MDLCRFVCKLIIFTKNQGYSKHLINYSYYNEYMYIYNIKHTNNTKQKKLVNISDDRIDSKWFQLV